MAKPSIKEFLGYTLVQACRAHNTRVRGLLNQIGLHPGQEMFLLSVWEEEGLTQTQLAERLQVQRATITNSVTRLERIGFIQRQPDPEDGRIYRIYLTEQGKSLRDSTRQVWEQMELTLTQGLTAAEIAMAHQLLAQITNNLLTDE